MLPHDASQKYLMEMLDRANFVIDVLAGRLRAELDTDRLLRSAVERELSIVGEALYQLHRILPQLAERVDNWREIIRFRHVLVHGYSMLDMDMIWDAVHDDLPDLIVNLEQLLSEEQS